MDTYDRSRGGADGRGGSGRRGRGTVIKGPHSALTDYLQEIGVSEHFRERRRREAEEREAQERQAAEATAAAAAASASASALATGVQVSAEEGEQTADAALAADMQQQEDAAVEAGSSSRPTRMRTRARAGVSGAASTLEPIAEAVKEAPAVAVEEQPVKTKGKGKGKAGGKGGRRKKKKGESDSDFDDENEDEANYRGGLNRSSARKGGRMKECEVCGKRFLQRGEHDESARVLCAMCLNSINKAVGDQAAVAKRARETTVRAPAKPRKRMRKNAGGLLEYEPGLPSLQDLCVRVIAKHLDQVESFGDITAQSLRKLCRIICKMRTLDEQTLGLFLGSDKSSLTLYDCTKITRAGIQRIIDECAQIEALDLEYCGRLDNAGLVDLGRSLTNLTSLRLDGAFLISDEGWAALLRDCGPRLTSFRVRFTGFGLVAMRALTVHCPNLVELCVSECIDFDDDCLATLSAPITDYEEEMQEPERILRLLNDRRDKKGKCSETTVCHPRDYSGPVPSWKPLSRLRTLELARPHKPMSSQTTSRVIGTLGSQLRVLDLSGFKDIDDDFVLGTLDAHCGNLEELYLGECVSITPDAMAQFFYRQRLKSKVAGKGYRRVGLGRCYMLTDSVIQELVLHSGATLTWLDLNSVDDNLSSHGILALSGAIYKRHVGEDGDLGEYVLEEQMSGCVNLVEIDVSWVRCTSDSVLETILARCKKIETVKVYGCPYVTTFAPRRPGLRYIGRECDTL
ncbi:UV-damaged DNA-binding protein rad7 [Coemansia sp. RSA 2599]|nr:UV-damaged DNA-binding protein rad7 [Coemansia sp. RSA 2599]